MKEKLNRDLFNYIIIFAFTNSYNYGKKKELSLASLKQYYTFMIKNIKDKLSEENSSKAKLVEDIYTTETIENINKIISSFIKKYGMFFEICNNSIIFNDKNIDGEALETLTDAILKNNKGLEHIFAIIATYECNIDGLKILGATAMVKELNAYLSIEAKLEKLYNNYHENQKQITTYMLIITNFLNKLVSINNYYTLLAYDRLLCEIKYNKYKYPDMTLVDTSKIKDCFPFDCQDISANQSLQNQFLRAIFSKDDLFFIKLEKYIGNLLALTSDDQYEDDDLFMTDDDDLLQIDDDETYYLGSDALFEEEIEESDDLSDAKLRSKEIQVANFFYLTYIEEIDNHSKKQVQDTTLKDAKSRLLYLLDNPIYNLSNKENRQNYLRQIKTLTTSEDFFEYYSISKIFFFDLINNDLNDEHALKKTLFIITYYNITNDQRIINMINKYQTSKVGKLLYDYIFNQIPIEIKPNNIKRKIKDITKHNNDTNKDTKN